MAAVYRTNELTRQEIWKLWITEMGLDMSHYDRFLDQYSSEVDELVAKAPAIDGAIELLLHLKTNSVKVFLSSATPEKTSKRLYQNEDGQHFLKVYMDHPAARTKPCLMLFFHWLTLQNLSLLSEMERMTAWRQNKSAAIFFQSVGCAPVCP